MTDETAVVAAMTARADQVIAERREFVGEIVGRYREMIAGGEDPAVASGTIACAAASTLDTVHASQLLAVAVMMLAQAPDRPVTP